MRINKYRIFWATPNSYARLKISLKRLVICMFYDISYFSKLICRIITKSNIKQEKYSPPINNFLSNNTYKHSILEINNHRPIIFASACESERHGGGQKYNGGLKELNLLVRLLRDNHYEAFLVTYDGNYEKWLVDHQPCISLAEYKKIVDSDKNIRSVTSWAKAKSFISISKHIYFWDMELAYSENSHFKNFLNLYNKKIINIAGISRTIQAWHMANFGKPSYVIPSMVDERYWIPNPAARISNRIGYMHEGTQTEKLIDLFNKKLLSQKVDVEFYNIKGTENEVIQKMQTCNIFLSINQGKDNLWGEGCPIPLIESQYTGAVTVGYDLIGNREIVINGFNGILVPRSRHDLIFINLLNLLNNPPLIDEIRNNANLLLNKIHKLSHRWTVVKEFLNL